jgi:hypothetical protein
MGKPRFNFLIDLPVRSDWKNIDLLRTSILNCFTAIFHDLDGCHSIAMVAGELLENAIKYGKWDRPDRLLHLRVWGGPENANVQVENPVEIGTSDIDRLMQTLAWVKEFKTPEEAYRAKLLEVAGAPRDQHLSRLGLVRIAYEGNCRLHAELQGDVLRVTSHMEL